MKIGGPDNIKSTANTKKKQKVSSGGDFASLLETGESESSAPSSAARATSMLDSLLALQEDESSKKQRAIKRGHSLLERLENIRDGLLLGEISPAKVQNLRNEIEASRGDIDDPELLSILSDIETRVAVELAKLDKI